MKLHCLSLILFLLTASSFSQKMISHQINVDDEITTVFIDLNKVFNIKLVSKKTKIIAINAHSEGEYANHFVINETRENKTLNISGNIAFTFPNNQDKLSAHKVHAIDVVLVVPEDLQVIIKSDIGNLTAEGNYKVLFGDFMSGNCKLNKVAGNITIQTVNGDIDLLIKKGNINAFTKYGEYKKEHIPYGLSNITLKSLKGGINVRQAK